MAERRPCASACRASQTAPGIAPAGFERFFAELVDLGGAAEADPALLGELCERYALEMDPTTVPDLVERFGLRFPGDDLLH